ncbi:ICP22 family protein [Streptomyces albicerus]|uniref:hypothetical protein n=1 Tax=Streptomyces albicerus TaxID=2569859 RepID=UPI0038503446
MVDGPETSGAGTDAGPETSAEPETPGAGADEGSESLVASADAGPQAPGASTESAEGAATDEPHSAAASADEGPGTSRPGTDGPGAGTTDEPHSSGAGATDAPRPPDSGEDTREDCGKDTGEGAGRPSPKPRPNHLPAAIPLPRTAPAPAPRPAFQPVTIRTARDAVTAAALYLRWLGYRDIRRADQRPPSGIGLAARGIVAQVDPTVRPASLRDVECLWLTAMTESAGCVYFSLAGYEDDARTCADSLGIPLFVLDLTGTPQPVNSIADELIATGA